MALEELTKRVASEMETALIKEGLYRREAAAMVKTWQDSWFAEDGLRVLYLLPRAWTDRTLPLTLDPAPSELARVMVGRAEVITSAQQKQLAEILVKAKAGDSEARQQAVARLKKLGRFAEPALQLATGGLNPEVTQNAWTLLQAARTLSGLFGRGGNAAGQDEDKKDRRNRPKLGKESNSNPAPPSAFPIIPASPPLCFPPPPAHNAPMKRVEIPLAAVFVALVGAIVWRLSQRPDLTPSLKPV